MASGDRLDPTTPGALNLPGDSHLLGIDRLTDAHRCES
jgi:hypothetical protein